MATDTAVIFSKLLEDFRKEWCKHSEAWLVIEIKAPGFSSTDYPPFDRTTHELLAPVRVPLNHERTVFTLQGYATFIISKNNKAARDSFKQLCKEAGAALPSEFWEALSEYCPLDVNNPASWWIALLLYLHGEVAVGSNGEYRDSISLFRPFKTSIEAIEQCNLATDDPVLTDSTETKTEQIKLEEDLLYLQKTIPTLDDSDENWISNKAASTLLGVDVKTLANRRSLNNKLESEGETFGVHDSHCFWRKHGKEHPRYYLPKIQKNAGQLGKIFPHNHLNELPKPSQ